MKIVLTTDLSEESRRAFQPAAALARKLGARVTLLHVVEDVPALPHGAPLAPPQASPDLAQRRADAERLLVEMRSDLPGDLAVDVVVESGADAAERVAQYAEEANADVIALSTHGRSGLRRLVMGSVAERILRHASRPVLCYPPAAE